jgi:hypothetical protein
MRRFQYLIAGALFASSAIAADVGVSISIGEPDFYGRIDIGDAPRPRLLYNEPVVIIRDGYYQAAPLYLRVRSGHAEHWKAHCHDYNACNRPVYFVRDDWYNNDYAPHYRERHGRHGQGQDNNQGHHGKGQDKNHSRGNGKGQTDSGRQGHGH